MIKPSYSFFLFHPIITHNYLLMKYAL